MVIPWDLLIMGQDQLIRCYIAAESEMDAKRRRLTVVTDGVYTGIRGAFSPTLRILALKSWASAMWFFPLYIILFYCRNSMLDSQRGDTSRIFVKMDSNARAARIFQRSCVLKEKFVYLCLRDALLRTRCAEKISFEENLDPTGVARIPCEIFLDLNIFTRGLDYLEKSNTAQESVVENEKMLKGYILPRRFGSLH